MKPAPMMVAAATPCSYAPSLFPPFFPCRRQIHYTERVNAELHDLLDKYEAEYFQSQASPIFAPYLQRGT